MEGLAARSLPAGWLRPLRQRRHLERVGARKDDARRVRSALDYLTRFNLLSPTFGAKAEVDELVKAQRWENKG